MLWIWKRNVNFISVSNLLFFFIFFSDSLNFVRRGVKSRVTDDLVWPFGQRLGDDCVRFILFFCVCACRSREYSCELDLSGFFFMYMLPFSGVLVFLLCAFHILLLQRWISLTKAFPSLYSNTNISNTIIIFLKNWQQNEYLFFAKLMTLKEGRSYFCGVVNASSICIRFLQE